MFEKLCAKFPDAPECADKDEMIKTTEEDIKQVEVDTQDVGDDVGGEEQTKEKICNLPGDKKYEYKVEDDMWFAREKGTEKWISLAADNMKKARCRLDKGCKDSNNDYFALSGCYWPGIFPKRNASFQAQTALHQHSCADRPKASVCD